MPTIHPRRVFFTPPSHAKTPVFSQNGSLGFTLLELVVVIALAVTILSIALVMVSKARVNSRDAKRVSELRQISVAMNFYVDNNQSYPQCAGQSICSGDGSVGGQLSQLQLFPSYMAAVPQDPRSPSKTYYYARGYRFYSASDPCHSTGKSTDYILGALLENQNNENAIPVFTCAMWNNASLNFIVGSGKD